MSAEKSSSADVTISSNSHEERPNGSHVREIDGGGCDIRQAPHPQRRMAPFNRGAAPPMHEITRLETPAALIALRVEAWIVLYHLTPREAEVLSRAALHGETPAQIAASLGVAAGTIATHRQHLLGKTGDDTLASAAHRLVLLASLAKSTDLRASAYGGRIARMAS